jgi:anti-anti-sigma regulatory factor
MYVPQALTALDRCDSCGAQALVRWVIMKKRRKNQQELIFCGHHSNSYAETLQGKGFVVFEDVRRLTEPENRLIGSEN